VPWPHNDGKPFAPLRLCEKKIFAGKTLRRHCEALRTVAPKVKYALKQSNLHRFDVEIASAT
jgi:hypothetical protein